MEKIIDYKGKNYKIKIEEKNYNGDVNYVAYLSDELLIKEFGETIVWKNDSEIPTAPQRNWNEEQQAFVDQITETILEMLG